MNRRQASKQETRRLIMAAARKLFLEKTVDDCTMRAIAKEAGVSAASVVVHFKNKRALLEATLGEDIDRTTATAIATFPRKGSLVDRLTHIWLAMYTFYDTNRDLYRTLIRSTIFEPEDQTPFLTGITITFFDFLQELIETEKSCGRMDLAVDADMMSKALFSLYFGVLIMFYRDPEMTPQDAAALVAGMTRQTLAGLVTKPKKE